MLLQQPKTPSYVKVSCALSGYKPYGSPASRHGSPASRHGSPALAAPVNDQLAGGQRVTLEYAPSKHNAYVKKVSEQFENLSSSSSSSSSSPSAQSNNNKLTAGDANGSLGGGGSGRALVVATRRHNGAESFKSSSSPVTQETRRLPDSAPHAPASLDAKGDSQAEHHSDDVTSSPQQLQTQQQENHAFVRCHQHHQSCSESSLNDVSRSSLPSDVTRDIKHNHVDIKTESSIVEFHDVNTVQESTGDLTTSKHSPSNDVTDGVPTSAQQQKPLQRTVISNSITCNSSVPAEPSGQLRPLAAVARDATAVTAALQPPHCNGDVINGLDVSPNTRTTVPMTASNSCDSLDSTSQSKVSGRVTVCRARLAGVLLCAGQG